MSLSTKDKESKYSSLQNFHITYDFTFAPIKTYLEKSNFMIEEIDASLKEKYDKWENEKKSSDLPDAIDIFYDEIVETAEFRNILNNSIFMSIYSLFENEFWELCVYCQRIEECALNPKDIKNEDTYIGKCRKFIVTELSVNLDSLNNDWSNIHKYRKIRNAIAHNHGDLKNPTQELKYFIDNTIGITLGANNVVSLDSIDFLKDFVDLIVKFLNGVCEEIMDQKK